jgi:pimeloyl-ACP methyl ester carboxylesterase
METAVRSLQVPLTEARLDADLLLPGEAIGVVVFVHGSGSGRASPRNRQVAEAFNRRGLAALLFDLLTVEEQRRDAVSRELRFDIGLLARRLVGMIDWLGERLELAGLPVGLYGASTGVAAALLAAAQRPEAVRAVVSRGGRSDLARAALGQVRAPTLQIVGGEDDVVLQLNRVVAAELCGVQALEVIPGASHLFEEPGALEQVERLAGGWFERYLGGAAG